MKRALSILLALPVPALLVTAAYAEEDYPENKTLEASMAGVTYVVPEKYQTLRRTHPDRS